MLLARELTRQAVDFRILPSSLDERHCQLPAEVSSRIVSQVPEGSFQLAISSALDDRYHAKDVAWWAFWETTQLPSGAVERMNQCASVIVPCHWSAVHFRRNGVTVPIYVIPCILDPAFLPSTNPSIHQSTNAFVLLAGGEPRNGSDRKGMDLLLRCFSAAFVNDRSVRLRVKLGPDAAIPVSTDSRISFRNDWLSPADLAAWYRSGHAFVSASSAEGWGYWPSQALACGLPVIGAAYSGQAEFLRPESSYLVDYREGPATGAYYAGLGKWAILSANSLVEQLRLAYQEHRNGRLSRRAQTTAAAPRLGVAAAVAARVLLALPPAARVKSPSPATLSLSPGERAGERANLFSRIATAARRRLRPARAPLVCIPVLNRGDLLRRCVESIGAQAARVLIINNGNDPGVAVACAYLSQQFPAVHVINPWGLSVAASWNRALEWPAPWCLFVNNDVAFAPGAVSRLAEAVRHNPGCGLFTVLPTNEFSAFVLQSWAARIIGPFDENFSPAYFEDEDYKRRAHLARVPILPVPGISAIHGSGPYDCSLTIFSDPALAAANKTTFAANAAYYARKWGGLPGHETLTTPLATANPSIH